MFSSSHVIINLIINMTACFLLLLAWVSPNWHLIKNINTKFGFKPVSNYFFQPIYMMIYKTIHVYF